jgi:hypothetical protein
MSFEDKLRQLSDRADEASQKALTKETKKIAAMVAQVLRDASWDRVTSKMDKDLKDAAQEARTWATFRDAAGYMEDKVFEPATGRIEELRLKRDLRAVQDEILQKFEDG